MDGPEGRLCCCWKESGKRLWGCAVAEGYGAQGLLKKKEVEHPSSPSATPRQVARHHGSRYAADPALAPLGFGEA